MNQQQHINNIFKMKPSGFDPLIEKHKATEDGLQYTHWKNYEGEENIDERSILPNEIVIDIDAKTTKKCREENRQICSILENQGLPFFVADTGGTGFHIHIFFQSPENIENIDSYRDALYRWIKAKAEEETQVETELWDDGVAQFDSQNGNGHLIRAIGGRKDSTAKRKTKVLPSTLEKKQSYKLEEVEYPRLNPQQDFWKLSKLENQKADLSWKEVTQKAKQIEEEKQEKKEKQLESTYEAEDKGLQALRDIPADEVIKAFFNKSVEPGEHLYCVAHGSSEKGTEEAQITEDRRYRCFGDSCTETGETTHWHNAIDLLIEGKEMEFQEAKQKLAEEFDVELEKSTEPTEATEGTEPDSLVDSYLNCDKPETVRLSGYLDDETYFHTLFLEKQGEVDKVVVTSDKKLVRVKNKLQELESDLDDGEKFQGDREKHDYDYFEIDGQKYKYKHKVATFNDLDLYTPSNEFLRYLKGEEPSKEVYEEVRREVKRYWDHFNEEWFDIATAWIIHTYLLDGIGYTAYLMLKGKEDTGKSTLQKILARLSYTGFFSGKSTSAVTSRLAHYTQASIHLDEFEKNADKETEGVYNTGQRKGAKYTFTNMNKDEVENQITALHSYCAKTLSVNSLYEFDSHFLSRNIILEATRTTRSLEKIENIDKNKREEFNQLRNELLGFTLFNHGKLISEIEDYRSTVNLSGREADKVGLISGIIRYFKDQERADEITEFLADKKELQEDSLNQRLKVLFEKIISEFGVDDKEIQIKPKVLANHVNRELEVDEDYELSSRGVGNRLRDYDILRNPSQSSRSGRNGSTVYTIPRDFLIDSFTRYDLHELRDELTEEGKNSGSVTSAPSVSSEENDEKPYRPQKEIVQAFDELEAVGTRDGIPKSVDKIEEESGLDSNDFEEVFSRMLSENLVKEDTRNPGKYVLDKKLKPENLVMPE